MRVDLHRTPAHLGRTPRSTLLALGLGLGALLGCGVDPDEPARAADAADAAPARGDVAGPDAAGNDATGDEVCEVTGPEGGRLRIDCHEASRPDATASSPGAANGPARSRAGVLPWTEVSLADAEAACAAAGARLCRRAELLAACAGASGRTFPYGSNMRDGTCNDYHAGLGVGPTGGHAGCVTPEGVADLVGNAAEWSLAADPTSGEPLAAGGSAVLSALAVSLRLDRCAGDETLPPTLRRGDLGFRCCERP